MIGLDTNILLRATVMDDPVQSPKARRIIRDLSAENPGYVNTVVLAEFTWTLGRRYGYQRQEILTAIEKMLQSTAFAVSDREVVIRAVTRSSDESIDLTDALVGESNLAAGCSATLTFDKGAARSAAFKLAT